MPFITFELRRGVQAAKVDRYIAARMGRVPVAPALPVHPPDTARVVRLLHDRALQLQKELAAADKKAITDVPVPVSGALGRSRFIRHLPQRVSTQGSYDLAAVPAIAVERVVQVYTRDPQQAESVADLLRRSGLAERVFPNMRAVMSSDPEPKRPRSKVKGASFADPETKGEFTGEGPSADDEDLASTVDSCGPIAPGDGYLDGEIGVAARVVLEAMSGRGQTPGQGVHVGLIELDFPSIAGVASSVGTGTGTADMLDHALKDVSILLGRGPVTGLAPAATLHPYAVHAQLRYPGIDEAFVGQLVQAIFSAAQSLITSPGGAIGSVLLVEVELVDKDLVRWPAYVHPYVRFALQLVWGAGVMVVLPAGNEHRDLSNVWSLGDFDHGVPRWPGALLVGGAWPRGKAGNGVCSNLVTASHGFGTPVHCFSWASSVLADGLGGAPEHDGTSSASAIIAGAACLLQSVILHGTRGARLEADTLAASLVQLTLSVPGGLVWQTGQRSARSSDGEPTNLEVGVQPKIDQIVSYWIDALTFITSGT